MHRMPPMRRITHPPPSRVRPTIVVLALAGCMLGAGYLALQWGQRAACTLQVERLHGLGAEEAAAALQQLDPAHAAQRRLLVTLVDNPRVTLAESARRRILEWIMQPAGDGADLRAAAQLALAEELAAAAARFALPGRQRAGQIAEALLGQASTGQRAAKSRLRTACETLVRLGDVRALTADETPTAASTAANPNVGSLQPGDLRPGLSPSNSNVPPLPGGGLTVDVSGPPAPVAREPRMLPPSRDDAPLRPLPEAKATATGDSPQPNRLRSVPNASPTLPPTVSTIRRPPQSRGPLEPGRRMTLAEARALRQTSATMPAADPGLAQVDLFELVRQLRGADADGGADIRQELQRRGFRDVHFRLAAQLFDPDPHQRRQMVRMLPELPGVDAGPWLAWLCRDPDAEVRLAAITIVATAGTPELLAEIESLARNDDDPRIQQQAEALMRLRRAQANLGR